MIDIIKTEFLKLKRYSVIKAGIIMTMLSPLLSLFYSTANSGQTWTFYMRQRVAALSKGANRAPHEIKIDLAVLPVTFCKGLFNQIHRKFTFQGKKIEPGTRFLDSWLISAIYIFWSVFNFLTSSTERPTNSAIFSSVIVPSSSIFFATFIIPSFNV